MKKMLAFAGRNRKELLRDPLNLVFALGFPLAVMLLLTMIQRNIPAAVFPIETIAPGMAVFGLSFISLFSGMLIAKDRGESFLMRLFASPLTPWGFICGYLLPLIPLSALQSAICLVAAVCLGLPLTANLLLVLLVLIPCALLYIAIGLLAGSVLNDKQVGGLCGALLTNLSAWLSGTWFDVALIGGAFEKVAYALPFAHAVNAGRAALSGAYGDILPHLLWVTGCAAVLFALAALVFSRKMKNATL